MTLEDQKLSFLNQIGINDEYIYSKSNINDKDLSDSQLETTHF